MTNPVDGTDFRTIYWYPPWRYCSTCCSGIAATVWKPPPLRQSKSDLTDAILAYIHAHYADVTLQQVADTFHFSRQYCTRLITDLTGYSFSQLITHFRIGRGEELLATTFLSVEEISEQLGYGHPETFIRAFKRIKGVTPGQYRRE